MPFLMVRNDIVHMKTDAIVNPSNRRLLQGRGTSRGIFLAAGEEALTRACRKAAPCETGKAVITPGFALPAKFIIHAVCPEYRGGGEGEEALLYSAYTESMRLALSKGLESIAFPLLSSGNYGYPKEEAMRTAVRAIRDFLAENEMTVYLVLYDRKAVEVRKEIAASLEQYLADHYVEMIDDGYAEDKDESYPRPNQRESEDWKDDLAASMELMQSDAKASDIAPPSAAKQWNRLDEQVEETRPHRRRAAKESMPSAGLGKTSFAAKEKKRREKRREAKPVRPEKKDRKLSDLMLRDRPETFSEMLLRLIDERGLKDSDVYNRANIDRRHFSKIRSDPNYVPKKSTVLSFAIALELSYDETKDLLMRAGYAFSICSVSDMIISFFIENGQYDIIDINEALFHYGQPVLGA